MVSLKISIGATPFSHTLLYWIIRSVFPFPITENLKVSIPPAPIKSESRTKVEPSNLSIFLSYSAIFHVYPVVGLPFNDISIVPLFDVLKVVPESFCVNLPLAEVKQQHDAINNVQNEVIKRVLIFTINSPLQFYRIEKTKFYINC